MTWETFEETFRRGRNRSIKVHAWVIIIIIIIITLDTLAALQLYVYLHPTYSMQYPLGESDYRAIWTTPPHNLQKNERLL
jgi:hypothetical protein